MDEDMEGNHSTGHNAESVRKLQFKEELRELKVSLNGVVKTETSEMSDDTVSHLSTMVASLRSKSQLLSSSSSSSNLPTLLAYADILDSLKAMELELDDAVITKQYLEKQRSKSFRSRDVLKEIEAVLKRSVAEDESEASDSESNGELQTIVKRLAVIQKRLGGYLRALEGKISRIPTHVIQTAYVCKLELDVSSFVAPVLDSIQTYIQRLQLVNKFMEVRPQIEERMTSDGENLKAQLDRLSSDFPDLKDMMTNGAVSVSEDGMLHMIKVGFKKVKDNLSQLSRQDSGFDSLPASANPPMDRELQVKFDALQFLNKELLLRTEFLEARLLEGNDRLKGSEERGSVLESENRDLRRQADEKAKAWAAEKDAMITNYEELITSQRQKSSCELGRMEGLLEEVRGEQVQLKLHHRHQTNILFRHVNEWLSTISEPELPLLTDEVDFEQLVMQVDSKTKIIKDRLISNNTNHLESQIAELNQLRETEQAAMASYQNEVHEWSEDMTRQLQESRLKVENLSKEKHSLPKTSANAPPLIGGGEGWMAETRAEDLTTTLDHVMDENKDLESKLDASQSDLTTSIATVASQGPMITTQTGTIRDMEDELDNSRLSHREGFITPTGTPTRHDNGAELALQLTEIENDNLALKDAKKESECLLVASCAELKHMTESMNESIQKETLLTEQMTALYCQLEAFKQDKASMESQAAMSLQQIEDLMASKLILEGEREQTSQMTNTMRMELNQLQSENFICTQELILLSKTLETTESSHGALVAERDIQVGSLEIKLAEHALKKNHLLRQISDFERSVSEKGMEISALTIELKCVESRFENEVGVISGQKVELQIQLETTRNELQFRAEEFERKRREQCLQATNDLNEVQNNLVVERRLTSALNLTIDAAETKMGKSMAAVQDLHKELCLVNALHQTVVGDVKLQQKETIWSISSLHELLKMMQDETQSLRITSDGQLQALSSVHANDMGVLREELLNAIERYQRLENAMSCKLEEIDEMTSGREALQERAEKSETDLESYKEEVVSLQEEVERISDVLQEQQVHYEQLEISIRVSKLESKKAVDMLHQEKDEYLARSQKAETAVTKMHNIIESLKENNERLGNDAQAKTATILRYETDITSHVTLMQKQEAEMRERTDAVTRLEESHSSLNQECIALKSEMESAQHQRQRVFERYQELQTQFQEAIEQKKKTQESLRQAESELTTTKTAMDARDQELLESIKLRLEMEDKYDEAMAQIEAGMSQMDREMSAMTELKRSLEEKGDSIATLLLSNAKFEEDSALKVEQFKTQQSENASLAAVNQELQQGCVANDRTLAQVKIERDELNASHDLAVEELQNKLKDSLEHKAVLETTLTDKDEEMQVLKNKADVSSANIIRFTIELEDKSSQLKELETELEDRANFIISIQQNSQEKIDLSIKKYQDSLADVGRLQQAVRDQEEAVLRLEAAKLDLEVSLKDRDALIKTQSAGFKRKSIDTGAMENEDQSTLDSQRTPTPNKRARRNEELKKMAPPQSTGRQSRHSKTQNQSPLPPSGKAVVISFSGFRDSTPQYSNQVKSKLIGLCKSLKASILTDADNFDPTITHVIAAPRSKTLKTFAAALTGRWIITDNAWIEESAKAGRWLDETEYGFRASSNPFFAKKFYLAPTFVKECEMNSNRAFRLKYCTELVQAVGQGLFVEDETTADYVIASGDDSRTYPSGRQLTWGTFIDLIPSPPTN